MAGGLGIRTRNEEDFERDMCLSTVSAAHAELSCVLQGKRVGMRTKLWQWLAVSCRHQQPSLRRVLRTGKFPESMFRPTYPYLTAQQHSSLTCSPLGVGRFCFPLLDFWSAQKRGQISTQNFSYYICYQFEFFNQNFRKNMTSNFWGTSFYVTSSFAILGKKRIFFEGF